MPSQVIIVKESAIDAFYVTGYDGKTEFNLNLIELLMKMVSDAKENQQPEGEE